MNTLEPFEWIGGTRSQKISHFTSITEMEGPNNTPNSFYYYRR